MNVQEMVFAMSVNVNACLIMNMRLTAHIMDVSILWFEMKLTHKWLFYDHFWPFVWHLYIHHSQNWDSDDYFEVHNGSKSQLVQKLWYKMQIFLFFSTPNLCCIFCAVYFFVFLLFFHLWHNFWTRWDIDLYSTTNWLPELQFCWRYLCNWQRNG